MNNLKNFALLRYVLHENSPLIQSSSWLGID